MGEALIRLDAVALRGARRLAEMSPGFLEALRVAGRCKEARPCAMCLRKLQHTVSQPAARPSEKGSKP